jgi:hypothetical protein
VTGDNEDWTPFLDEIDGTEFKWGLNGDTGELTIWQVGGPGDGHPDHRSVLSEVWGRDDLYQPGDLLGTSHVDQDAVKIFAYRSSLTELRELPEPLLAWARETFPNHELKLNRY